MQACFANHDKRARRDGLFVFGYADDPVPRPARHQWLPNGTERLPSDNERSQKMDLLFGWSIAFAVQSLPAQGCD